MKFLFNTLTAPTAFCIDINLSLNWKQFAKIKFKLFKRFSLNIIKSKEF